MKKVYHHPQISILALNSSYYILAASGETRNILNVEPNVSNEQWNGGVALTRDRSIWADEEENF